MKFILGLLVFLPGLLSAQHDNGRNAVRQMAEGKFQNAESTAIKKSKKVNSPNTKGEQEFVLSLIFSAQGKAEEAMRHASLALKNGVPIERFIAGPRHEFNALYKHPDYIKLKEAVTNPILHGPALGSITVNSAKFWIRTTEELKFTVKVSDKEKSYTASANTLATADYTGVAEVKGLNASTEYSYEVIIDGKSYKKGMFKTNPEAGKSGSFTIAFGGGAGYNPQYEHIWGKIKERKPQALLMLGDNVYIDDPEHQVTQKYCYYRRQARPEWQKLVSSVPVYSIYDDHDFGDNDCEPGAAIDKPAWKKDVWKTFSHNWANPYYGGGDSNPGCWYDFKIADVHFIMLDCRYYRERKMKSMLGDAQRKWLFKKLESSESKFKILVSSVPWAPGVKPGSKDTWDGYSEEREEVFSFIEKNKLSGVLLVSADRHRSDLRVIKRPNGYNLYEMMSSRLSNTHVHPLVENASGSEFILGYNKTCSFGLLDFDSTGYKAKVTYRIVSIDGKVQKSFSITEDELK